MASAAGCNGPHVAAPAVASAAARNGPYVVESPASRNGHDENIRARFFVVEPDRPQLAELARRIDVGQLHPVVGQVTDLADGPRAFAAKKARGCQATSCCGLGEPAAAAGAMACGQRNRCPAA